VPYFCLITVKLQCPPHYDCTNIVDKTGRRENEAKPMSWQKSFVLSVTHQFRLAFSHNEFYAPLLHKLHVDAIKLQRQTEASASRRRVELYQHSVNIIWRSENAAKLFLFCFMNRGRRFIAIWVTFCWFLRQVFEWHLPVSVNNFLSEILRCRNAADVELVQAESPACVPNLVNA